MRCLRVSFRRGSLRMCDLNVSLPDHEHAKDAKRHAYSLSGTEAPGGVMLLEALIAILIFSIGILAVVGMQTTTIKNVTDSKHRTEAAFLANKLLSQMWTDAETSLRMLIREAALSDPPHWLGRPVNTSFPPRRLSRRSSPSRRKRDGRPGDHPGAGSCRRSVEKGCRA